mgnify:CR=1 FL=1
MAQIKLLPLAPIGIGTTEVESLFSYLRRMAYYHGVSVEQFGNLLLYATAKPSSPVRPTRLASAVVSSIGQCTSTTRRVLNAFCELNWPYDIYRTTLLHMGRFDKHMRNSLRSDIAWCPECLRADRASGHDPYFRLLWLFSTYKYCHYHGMELVSRCSQCVSDVNWGKVASLDPCLCSFEPKCSVPLELGQSAVYSRFVNSDILDFLRFVQTNRDTAFSYHSIRDNVQKILSNIPASVKEDIRYGKEIAGLSKENYSHTITFLFCRRVARRLGMSLPGLLVGEQLQMRFWFPDESFNSLPQELLPIAKRKMVDRESMREQILELLFANQASPKPLSFYATELRISSDGLRHRYPSLSEKIVNLYRCWLQQEAQKKKIIINIIFDCLLKGEGAKPSKKKVLNLVCKKFGLPKNLSRKEFERQIEQDELDAWYADCL